MTGATQEIALSATGQRLLIAGFFLLAAIAVVFGLDLDTAGRVFGGAIIVVACGITLLIHRSVFGQRAAAAALASDALALVGRHQALTVWQVDGSGRTLAVLGGESGEAGIARALGTAHHIGMLTHNNPALAALVKQVGRGHACVGEAEVEGVPYRHRLTPQAQEGEHFGFVCISENLSRQRGSAGSPGFWDTLQRHSSDAIVVLDTERVILSVNPAFVAMTGYTEEHARGKRDDFLLSAVLDSGQPNSACDQLRERDFWEGETMVRHHSGHVVDVRLVICTVRDAAGRVTHYIVTLSDLSKTRKIHDELRHLANHDNLTDLPNRRLFLDRLDQGVRRARREQRQLTVFFVDLDDFKGINDDYGHHVGDEVLRRAGRRLLEAVRASDTVARLAGDEFTIIADSPHEETEALRSKIGACFTEPFRVGDRTIRISASVGAAVYPDDGENVESLMQHADQAMYRVKAQSKGASPGPSSHVQSYGDGLYFSSELRLAIRRGQLKVVYQPQIDLNKGGLIGVEALLRWDHHCRGSINPADFIGLAEESGITDTISAWTLDQVARQFKAWRRWRMPIQQVAINIAISQIKDLRYPQTVIDVMAKHGIPAAAIMLEVDEEIYLRSPGLCKIFFERARQLGLRLCIDQFGAHTQDYSYIGSAPVDAVKVNQALLAGQVGTRRDPRFLAALVALCRVAGKAVVAVGVESSAAESEFVLAGCQLAQGFLYSRPLTAEAMRTFRIESVPRAVAESEVTGFG